MHTKMCLTICNHDYFVIRSLEGVIRSAPKTISSRYFKNGNGILHTFFTTCFQFKRRFILYEGKEAVPSNKGPRGV